LGMGVGIGLGGLGMLRGMNRILAGPKFSPFGAVGLGIGVVLGDGAAWVGLCWGRELSVSFIWFRKSGVDRGTARFVCRIDS